MAKPTYAFILFSDTSHVGLGAELFQLLPEREWPIQYLSHQLSLTECKYASFEKALADKGAIESSHYYLWDGHFTIVTDHDPLAWLHQMNNTNPHLILLHLAC